MDARWRSFRKRWTGRFWMRPAGRMGSGMIRCFSFRRWTKRLRNCGPRRRAITAIAGRRFGGCSRYWNEKIRFHHRGHRVHRDEAEMAAKKKVRAGKKRVAKKPEGKKPAAKKAAGVTAGTDPKRVAAILAGLDAAYPNATCELNYSNAFQLLIATILSAQCTDVRVNQVTSELFKKYTKPEDFAYASPAELENEIRPTGFFRNKT